ncbi:MAG: hypothetical protein L0Z70_10110 [Chloroflexi bacterium]|nr:hypothetical protein [Chloroflexota bacterium]
MLPLHRHFFTIALVVALSLANAACILTGSAAQPGSAEPTAINAEPGAAAEEPASGQPPAAQPQPQAPDVSPTQAPQQAAPAADNPAPPAQPVRLIFIHHSTGGNWLADPGENSLGGDLGRLLMENNYFVSATNYGWGPDSIGDATDIGHWWDWFRGENSATYLDALYHESGQNIGDYGPWPRLAQAPGGENTVILFKSCYPNSHIGGQPDDPPTTGDNPLRGAWAGDDSVYTVGNVKGLYNDLLVYFASRPDKLLVVITAPPLAEWESDAVHAANARAVNDWLVDDWLDGYALPNVAVFDFYTVLTSNGGDADTHDLDQAAGNHHRWRNNAIEHSRTVENNFSAYPSGDSHPSHAGNVKAAEEFVPLLNVFYNRWQGNSAVISTIYVPLVTKEAGGTTPPIVSGELLGPADLIYRGAFRLPQGGERPLTFAYGGAAMTFNPKGDPSGAADGYAGSLFISGHDRLPYGELPNGNQIAELSIPPPSLGRNVSALPQAEFIQGFRDVAAGFFPSLEELPRLGLLYLDDPATGPLLHLIWGQHLQPDSPAASHTWFSTNLANPQMQPPWFIAGFSPYSVNGYLMEIPADWADLYVQGRPIATGRYKDGGWSGMGPALIAYRPWDDQGNPPAANAQIEAAPLLLYEGSQNALDIERAMDRYQHPDEWEGGAWITTGGGKSAVLFAGNKSLGEKYWYGFANPAGTQFPCVEQEMVDQFTLCRLADGTHCPPDDLVECAGHNDYRGWWSTRFEAQFIFYDPADLARVAVGEMQPWEPQPYAVLSVDERLFLNPSGVEADMLGTGAQRRYRIGEVAYDRASGNLYVLELFADGAQPVIHVWNIT